MLDLRPTEGDVLLVVDMQKGFTDKELGELPVKDADTPGFLADVNHYINVFRKKGVPVVFTRDWHPAEHSSFEINGGIWAVHCVAGTEGAEFIDGLHVENKDYLISKGQVVDREEYSGFQSLDEDGESILIDLLDRLGVKRVFVCGLATDYCVKDTALDASKYADTVVLLKYAIKAVNFFTPDDGLKAIEEMMKKDVKVI